MANFTGGVTTVCPYYIRETAKSITCTGVIRGTNAMSRFENSEEKAKWQSSKCTTFCYSNCPIARESEKHYEEDERG